ncbi:MAG TPA: PTS sugar transporter subunit IIA [Elusimicrobiota bacterium]|nr:PTS sugar transporter subunit IIA [Elusimicrobiota bacterium]
MIGVLIVTHGRIGEELLRTAEGIVGKQVAVRILGLDATEGPDAFCKKIRVVLEEMKNPAGVLVLADMMGGTPCNSALRQCQDPQWNFEIVTGVNLPMLVSVLTKRHYMPLDLLAQKITDDGPRTIQRPVQKLRTAGRRENA